jgi:carbon storage regulator
VLVLTRGRDQDVVFDFSRLSDEQLIELRAAKTPIRIAVVDIRGDRVRLGITAPPAVSVHRREVYDAIRRERAAAQQRSAVSDH